MEKRYFAIHMKHKTTGETRIKRVKAVSVDEAHCNDFGYKKEWSWTATEPFHNVEDDVMHIGRGYYKFKKNLTKHTNT